MWYSGSWRVIMHRQHKTRAVVVGADVDWRWPRMSCWKISSSGHCAPCRISRPVDYYRCRCRCCCCCWCCRSCPWRRRALPPRSLDAADAIPDAHWSLMRTFQTHAAISLSLWRPGINSKTEQRLNVRSSALILYIVSARAYVRSSESSFCIFSAHRMHAVHRCRILLRQMHVRV